LREYESRFPSIVKIIYRDTPCSRGIDFSKVKGEFVALCSGDDYWCDREKLQTQIMAMEGYPDVDMSFHPAYKLINNRICEIIGRRYSGDRIFSTDEVIVGGAPLPPTVSIIFRKRFLDDSSKGGILYLDGVMVSIELKKVLILIFILVCIY